MEGGAADRNHSGEGQGGTHTTGNHRGEGGADRNHSGEGQGGTHTTGNHRGEGGYHGVGGGRGGLAALHHTSQTLGLLNPKFPVSLSPSACIPHSAELNSPKD